jgi:hypothetical protein
MRRFRAQTVEPFVRKCQNTDHTLKIMIFRVKIDRLNLFLLPFSIGKIKRLNILDLAMVSLGLSFETKKIEKKNFFGDVISEE